MTLAELEAERERLLATPVPPLGSPERSARNAKIQINKRDIQNMNKAVYQEPVYPREALIKESFRTGQLAWLLFPHQRPIYDSVRAAIANPETSAYIINCSRQFGKSFVMFLIEVEECFRKSNRTCVHIAPLKSQVSEIINGNTFGIIFKDCPQELIPKIDGNTIVFYNGSRIRMAGTDAQNYQNLRGGAAHLITLDEGAFMNDLVYGVLPVVEPMLKTTAGKIIYASTPPMTLDHDYIDILRAAIEEGTCSTFTIWDDKSLTDAQLAKIIKQCDGKETTKFKREYECKMVTETDLSIIAEWDEKYEYAVERDQLYSLYHKYTALDTGFVDLTACLFGYYDFQGAKLIIEDEYHINGPAMTTEILAANMRAKEVDLWGATKPYLRIADNNNLIIINDLNVTYHMPFMATNKEYLEEMVNKVRIWVAQGKLVVHPRCKNLIGCLRNGIWDKHRRGFERSKVYGHYDHLAALVYLVRNVDIYTNPIPPLYNMSLNNTQINPAYNTQSGTAKSITEALLPRRNNKIGRRR